MLAKLKKRKRLRTHGYLERTQSATGRKVLRDRRRKGRHALTVSVEKHYQDVRGKSKLHIVAGGRARVVSVPGSTKRIRAK